uniref:Aminotransferase-like plant mobile domain-containing protein n=1 Tax=Fagus sylvatica TaxID=28930 RepID=A0A2N9GBW9_FAGSY
MPCGKGPDKDVLASENLNYMTFIKNLKEALELSSHRQSPSKWVCVDLSSFVLGELYRAMYLFSFDPKQSHGGPLWLMQMWAYSYFPTIAPELHPTREPKSYGRPGCKLGMLAKSPTSLPTSYFSVIPPGSDCLRILCFLRLKGFGGNKGHQCWSGGLLPLARGQIVWPYLVAASASNLDPKYSLEYKSFDFERRGRVSVGMEHIASYVAPTPL